MNKLLVLIIGLALIYLAASGRLQKVWDALSAPQVGTP
jgi:hypothetical protein